MEFKFRYRVKPVSLWILTMVNIYRSMMAVVNIIFTVSMVLLIVRFWNSAGATNRILMVAGLLLFPVLQPLLIFWRSREIVGRMPGDLQITFHQNGIEIWTCGGKSSHVDYAEVKSVIRIFRMLIIYTRSKQGFILDDEMLSDKGKNLSIFLSEKLKGRP
jgi:hypothetical protein